MPTRTLAWIVFLSSSVCCFSATSGDQCIDGETCVAGVPRLVKFNGVLKDSSGKPHTGIVAVTLAIYDQSSGGNQLWQETQNIQLDQQGRYALLLGAGDSDGLPPDLFSSKEPRWLGVQAQLPDESEQPRVLLVSVPYALQAGNAQTLGGLPPSAFLRAAPSSSVPTTSIIHSRAYAAAVSPTPNGSAGTASAESTNSSLPGSRAASAARITSNIIYADQFSGGVPDAIAACPSPGCIIYADGQTVDRNLGTIDPGSKAITLYLGPFTYNVKQITLQRNLKIIGMGSGITFLQSVNGNNPLVVVPQAAFSAATNVMLSGFRLLGSVGNTSEDAMFWDSSGFTGSGVWYSELHDIAIIGFAGNGIHIRGTSAAYTGMSQFVQFNRVVVWRSKGGGNALRVEGAAYEFSFNDCQFDGTAPGDGTNIFLGAFTGNAYAVPTNISFSRLTTQLAATAVQIDGGWAISFYSPHHEYLWGGYLLTGNTGAAVRGLTISDAGFQASGVNGGAGYLLKVTNPSVSGVQFLHNHIMGPADAVVVSPPGTGIVYRDNEFFGTTDLPATSGITLQLAPDSSIKIGGAHTIGLTSSPTPITTIKSSLGAGETATFFTINGRVMFGSGGNINLMGAKLLSVNGSITFAISDLGGTPSWIPISQRQVIPTLTPLRPPNKVPGAGTKLNPPRFFRPSNLSSRPRSLERH
jgi:hypothetical protein